MKTFLLYLGLISLLSVFVTAWDKAAAKLHVRRVPEAVLLLLAALGGSVGMYVTMRIIRHKTRHAKFMVGIPVIFALQLCVLLAVRWFM